MFQLHGIRRNALDEGQMSPTTHWKLTLSYDGSGFHGWQIQPGLKTVQGVLGEALERLTGERVLPQGSGRTDAGVHALAQVASFQLRAPLPPANLRRALNRILPVSIRVLEAEIAPPGFHARHSARRKTYEYRIFERRVRQGAGQVAEPAVQSAVEPAVEPIAERICSPFLAPYVWDCDWALELEPMQAAAAALCGTRDFTSMAAGDPDRSAQAEEDSDPANPDRANPVANPVKTIFTSHWSRHNGLLLYRVTGSGFLHHMVRNLVGTMADIGRGSLEAADMERILAARDRTQAGPTAPARGLYLVEVFYDEDGAPTGKSIQAAEDAP
jgi:tRNA pseudouridine38-40 synthase